MRVIVAALLLSGIFGVIACGGKKKKKAAAAAKAQAAKPQIMKVDGYIVRPQPFQENIEVPGTILANEVAEIHPEVSGRIVSLNVAEGKLLEKEPC